MSSQNDGCNYYRVYLPSLWLKRSFNVAVSVDDFNSVKVELKKDKKTVKLLEEADIIVLQRLCSLSVFHFIDGLKELKPRKIVFESDDLVEEIYKTNLGSLFWDEERKKMLDELLKKCDLITVSTDYLKEKWQEKNENIVVLPNSLDFRFIKRVKKDYSSKRKLKILVSGSCLYPENLNENLLSLFKEIAQKYHLVLFGLPDIDEDAWRQLYKLNRKMYYLLKKFVKPLEELKKYGAELKKNVVFGKYYEELVKIDADIALIPRGNHEFNKAKSNLKILEMTAFKVPCIVSPMDEYKEFIEKGLVLKAENNKEWLERIEKLEDAKLRQELAEKCYHYVFENYNIAKNYKLWEKAYKSLLYERESKN